MRKRVVSVVVAAMLAAATGVFMTPAVASESDVAYTGTHFGAGNRPPGCETETDLADPTNVCHHMRTDMNGLDSPKVDVLILVPASPHAEREARIMRQAVEMWEGGIDHLAPQMGLDWLGEGMDFHVTVDVVDPTGDGGGEFTTYPIVDPEIVLIGTTAQPVVLQGIGIDPLASPVATLDGQPIPPPTEGPCHGVANPFDFAAWEALPGFDDHHEGRAGTYVEDCGGAGGNICFAVNNGVDLAPDLAPSLSFFDLVAHELGHCLTIGHVGDGLEGSWGALPSNDIMAYSDDPPTGTKCVSTLDVEGIATTQSRYLDTNGDGRVDAADKVNPNNPNITGDPGGEGSSPFHTQHPRDHHYASATGSPVDCPQPDVAVLPGPRTDWTPEQQNVSNPGLTLTSPSAGATSANGVFTVAGSVAHVSTASDPTSTTGSVTDAPDDATTPETELKQLDVAVTADRVVATLAVDALPATGVDGPAPASYSVTINKRRFESFVRYGIVDGGPLLWDDGAGAYVDEGDPNADPPVAFQGSTEWDLQKNTVKITLSRDYLAAAGVTAPYFLGSHSALGFLTTSTPDDYAPDRGKAPVGVAAPATGGAALGLAVPTANAGGTFTHPDGNTFYPDQSTLGATNFVLDRRHHFNICFAEAAPVTFTLSWTDAVGGADFDLDVTPPAGVKADEGATTGSSTANPESVTYTAGKGQFLLAVDPFVVTDPENGSTYTLTWDSPSPLCPPRDVCANGGNEQVHVYLDGQAAPVASRTVDTFCASSAAFSLPVNVGSGQHTLRVEWDWWGKVLATESVTVGEVTTPTTTTPGKDKDKDKDKDKADKPNNAGGGHSVAGTAASARLLRAAQWVESIWDR